MVAYSDIMSSHTVKAVLTFKDSGVEGEALSSFAMERRG